MNKNRYTEVFEKLLGRKIKTASHAASMRGFVFAALASGDSELWVIHIQCSWRIETRETIVTGSGDWDEPANPETAVESGDPAQGGSLQDSKLRALFRDPDLSIRAITNRTELFVCTHFELSDRGDVTIGLTGDYVLRLFPASCRGEQWRVFRKGDTDAHVVFESS
ncbi:MAG TPA: hypothetical protein VKX49_20935 [Bryobacteraceae bacterium]|nr:hypothetical protein [Bryobacteraceae bacterium]